MAQQLDARFFKPFVDGTLNTLKVQCNTDAKPEKPFIKGQREQPVFNIAGVIGMTSSAFNGTITLCFPEKVFLAIMSRMLSDTFTTITKDLQDGAGELLNIIYGHAKTEINNMGHQVQKAIPTVIRGEALVTSHISATPVMVLPFKTDSGEFHIEICTEAHSM